MIQFQVDVRHDVEKAFAYAERSRARALLAAESIGSSPMGLRDLQHALPDRVTLLCYVSLSDRLLTWTITRSEHHLAQTPIHRDELDRLASRFRSASAEQAGIRAAVASQLSDLLIRPVSARLALDTTLVIVADGALQQVPFAALRDPSRRRYLIEDHPLIVSPSATFFAAPRSQHRPEGNAAMSALLVGNPETDTASALRPLPAAE